MPAITTMDTEQLRKAFAICGILLQYPDENWHNAKTEFAEIIKEIPHRQIVALLEKFLLSTNEMSDEDFTENYVREFDFSKNTNFYLTYYNQGEQRERGLEILLLKEQYMAAGFDVNAIELPDYLPVLLEFASIAPKENVKEVLKVYTKHIEELRKRLIEDNSFYTFIFDAILIAIELFVERRE
ncbi:MAG: narJ [Firmicutes bacterium]|nr:narJ [Bacillota bacterium]